MPAQTAYFDASLPKPSAVSFSDAPSQLEVTPVVNTYLHDFFTSQHSAAQQLDPAYARLWQASQDLVLAGGKRIRPYLAVLAYKVCGGHNDQDIIPVAAAHELLHAALLMHDDIIDRDTIRYGRPNVAGQYRKHYHDTGLSRRDATHFSNGAALLAGDLLLTYASAMITESAFDDAAKLQAQRCLQAGMFRVAGGEMLDMESTFAGWQDINPLTIASLKTASYSFESPLLTGARLAGADGDALEHLQQFAWHAGIAFQLTDDVLGVFGDDGQTGKSNTSDLEEGKLTLMLQETLRRSDQATRQHILTTCGNGAIDADTAAGLRRIIEQSGARLWTEQRASDEVNQALAALDALDLAGPARMRLAEIVGTMISRSK